MMRRGRTQIFLALALVTFLATPVVAQEIPQEEYLNYPPIQYPRLVSRTDASVELHLFGDRCAPGYHDESPIDGIDDDRGRTLHALATRFAPYLVQNTTALPMDFKRFWDQGASFPVYVDTWNVAAASPELVHRDNIGSDQRGNHTMFGCIR